MYSGSAGLYDAIYAGKDYASASSVVTRAIRAVKPAAHSLLEIACGTGRYLEHFQKSFTVEGLDINPDLLKQAAQRLPGCTFHLADMTGFDTGKTYDVVACLFSSIVYVQTVERLNMAVAAMVKHVAPGGLLLIEPFFPPDKYWTGHLVLNTTDLPDLKIAWTYVMQRRGNLGILDIHYMVTRPAGVETFSEVHELGLFADADYASAFRTNGLDFTYDPVGAMGRGLYVAQRKAAS
jgi:ubiquinone/menaquinone biosynthesis C-methylase UbiE